MAPESAPGRWTLRRSYGGGFGPPEIIKGIDGRTCSLRRYLKAVDLDGDGKVELLVPPFGWAPFGWAPFGWAPKEGYSGTCAGACTYVALSWDEGWSFAPTNLSPPPDAYSPRSQILFLDVNGDGLPDALKSGFDGGRLWTYLRTYLNIGKGFDSGRWSLSASVPAAEQSWNIRAASTLDHDGDGPKSGPRLTSEEPSEVENCPRFRPLSMKRPARNGEEAVALYSLTTRRRCSALERMIDGRSAAPASSGVQGQWPNALDLGFEINADRARLAGSSRISPAPDGRPYRGDPVMGNLFYRRARKAKVADLIASAR